MAEHFVYHLEDQLSSADIDEAIGQAHEVIAGIEAFQAIPARNQKLVLDMAGFAIDRANTIDRVDRWRENYWGLYVVGSRSSDKVHSDNDLDLLSVGTFYHDQGFTSYRQRDIFEGFKLVVPDELPDEYNVGDTDRKYLVHATPTEEGVLPVDLSVVDLTFTPVSLDDFKETMDVAEGRGSLARLPLLELTVAEQHTSLHF